MLILHRRPLKTKPLDIITLRGKQLMARNAKRLRVTLEALRFTSVGSDPGSTLEIKGQLEARGVFIDGQGDPQPGFAKVLWQEGGERYIAANTEISINSSAEFLVFERDFLWIGGFITEVDTFGSDDSLGNGFRKIQYVDIKNEIVNVGFNESDQEVLARYKVEVLGIENHPEA
jgi:hypothetical protein